MANMVMANIPIPKTVESIYEDYRMRREGLLMALVDDHKDLWAACGPDRDNLCLYSYPDGNWAVDLPVVEVPPELPEPVLGINFARDGMDRKDWLALCAVHSDAWLMSLIFFYAARFDADGRAELFSLVNQHPTVYEVVTGRVARNKMYKRKLPRPAGPTPAQQAAAAASAAAMAAFEEPNPFVRPGYQAADQPLPTGRLLTAADVSPALSGRQAELFWPDDGKWYLIQFNAIYQDTNKADVQYATGEFEQLDLTEVINDGHCSLLSVIQYSSIASPSVTLLRAPMRAFASRTSFRAPAIANQQAKGPCRSTAAAAIGSGSGATHASRRNGKLVWLSTTSQDALTAGLEAGLDTVVFDESQAAVSNEWQQLGRFTAITRAADGRLLDAASGAVVGHVRLLSSPEDLRAAEREAATVQGVVVMDASDWQIIPAENLVAAYAGNTGATLLAAAPDCASGRTMLEALEAGTDGVLLQTDSPAEVRALMKYVRERRHGAAALQYESATVTSVQPVGMGDRACVDLCSLLVPGEGLLCGSFARSLFLVHSYLQLPGGRTGYLSELKSGAEVLVADAEGNTRTAIVGRVKIEQRPLVLVEAELPDGESCSVLLQNAETVRLVGPVAAAKGSGGSSTSGGGGTAREGSSGGDAPAETAAADGYVWQQGGSSMPVDSQQQGGEQQQGWGAVSVSELAPGHRLLVLRQASARHTGVAIEESITER
ncbi:3-dehydroquinate synthase [Chlorella vulgaris]